jgi:ELWxxDGT repeat protein
MKKIYLLIILQTFNFLFSFSAFTQNPLPVTNVDGGLKINSTGPYNYGQNFVTIGNTIFFVGIDNEHGQALWKYNTTTREYTLVKDVYPGPSIGTITNLVALNNKVYFAASADITTNMFDIYMSDGTEAGTILLFASTATEKFNNGPFLLKAGSYIYFETLIESQGNYLYSINGNTVTQLKQIYPAGNSPFGISPYSSASYGGYFFFIGYDDAHGSELWRSDGTVAGTGLYADMSYNPPGGGILTNFYGFEEANNQLLFTGLYTTLDENNSPVGHRGHLKMTSASSAPELFYDFDRDANSSGIHIQLDLNSLQQNETPVLNGILYLGGATVNSVGEGVGAGLYRTDGTAAGTYLVKDGSVTSLSKFNDKIIFERLDGGDRSLWLSDGTDVGTYKIGDKFVNSGLVGRFYIRGNRMYASGYYDGITHLVSAVWSTDGTNEGTVILTPDCYTTSNGPQDIFENIGDSIYFQGQLNGCVENTQLNKFTIPTKIWLGKVSTNWNDAGNWAPVGVPGNADDIVIPNGITNYPVISANAVARNLWINWGSISVASGVQLTVNGELSVIGNLTGDGSLVMASAGNDNLHGQGIIDIASVIINGSDVTLKGNKELKKVEFQSDNKITLGNNNLVITDNTDPVSGFNANRFFVTNGTGSLTFKGVGASPVVFPVGTSASSYNPVTITNSGDVDDYSVRVSPMVYQNGNDGTAFSNNAVNRTWLINEASAGGSDVTLTTQWNNADELPGFNKSEAYLSHFTDNAWDVIPAGVVSGSNPFTISRSGLTSFSPFAIFSTGLIDSDNDGVPDGSDCAPNDNTKWQSAVLYIDADGDGYDAGTATVCYGANVPAGYATTTLGSDCNDNNAAINASVTYYRDADADGYGNAAITSSVCSFTPPAGYVSNNTDCNDGDATIYPGAPELCDGKDNNCNFTIDEGCAVAPSISINDITVYESQGLANLTVSLSRTSAQAIKINYTTVEGTAISKGKGKNPAIDFVAKKGTLTIPAGSLTGTISITIINDGITEPAEYFDVQLSLMKNANASISDGSGRVTILDGAPLFATNAARTVSDIAISSAAKDNRVANNFMIKALPNPTNTQFTLKVESGGLEGRMNLKVMDVFGRVMEVRTNIFAGQTVQVGNNYRPGVYFIEVTQGINKKQLKLIKL